MTAPEPCGSYPPKPYWANRDQWEAIACDCVKPRGHDRQSPPDVARALLAHLAADPEALAWLARQMPGRWKWAYRDVPDGQICGWGYLLRLDAEGDAEAATADFGCMHEIIRHWVPDPGPWEGAE